MQVADRAKFEPSVGAKPMHQPLAFVGLIQLLLHRYKQGRFHDFDLDIGLIIDPAVDQQMILAIALDRMSQQASTFGKGMVRSSANFSQYAAAATEPNHVSVRRNIQFQRVLLSLDGS